MKPEIIEWERRHHAARRHHRSAAALFGRGMADQAMAAVEQRWKQPLLAPAFGAIGELLAANTPNPYRPIYAEGVGL